jgi:uncharacterized protein YggE
MTRKLIVAVFLVASAALAQTPAPNPNPNPNPETVSVTGTSRITAVPDRFTFNVGVQTSAPKVEDAVNQNNERVAAVVAALKKAGATDQEVRTSNFSIYPQQDYQQGQMPRVVGYQVSNNITVTKKQIADAGKLLQVALNAGANESGGLQFVVSDPTTGRDEGLRLAVQDARAKAALLARAAGRSLGRALYINEGSSSSPQPRPMVAGVRGMMAKAEMSQVPVESGSEELVYSVSIVFELR